MKAAKMLVQDTKMVNLEVAQKIVGLLKSYVDNSKSATELAQKIQSGTPDAKVEFLVCQALSCLADEAGRYRGGQPSLSDQILNTQFQRVDKYGEDAYRLSQKQIAVVAREAWMWLRPEMPQGNF